MQPSLADRVCSRAAHPARPSELVADSACIGNVGVRALGFDRHVTQLDNRVHNCILRVK